RQEQGLDPKDIERMRGQFDLANEELRKSWDSFSRVVPYYPAYGRVVVGPGVQAPCSARLGVVVETPGETLVEQLNLPKGKYVVIRHVLAQSPAAKVGLKINDILMEIDGTAVPAYPLEF